MTPSVGQGDCHGQKSGLAGEFFVAADIEKDIRANALLTSGNFAAIHKTIAELAIYDKFPEATARKIATAFIQNDQVRWIKDDEDVKEFYDAFIDINKDNLTDEHRKHLA